MSSSWMKGGASGKSDRCPDFPPLYVILRTKSPKLRIKGNMTQRQKMFLGLWNDGLTFAQIAKAMKVGIRQTFKWRQLLNLPNRPRGGVRA